MSPAEAERRAACTNEGREEIRKSCTGSPHNCAVRLGKPRTARQVVRISNLRTGRPYKLIYGAQSRYVFPGMWVKVRALQRVWVSSTWGWL